jgi:transposase
MAPTILPDPTQLQLVRLSSTERGIMAIVEAAVASRPCPLCGAPSVRVHSRYVRRVTDVPWHGVPFRLQVHVRRFVCARADCARAIFTERLPGVVLPYGRKTLRLSEAIRLVGCLLGGEAGRRLLVELGMATSPDTILRTLRRIPLPATPTPRVLSVDDFAFRRGRRYGTILVDLERRRLVDLLPDRTAQTFAAWLRAHSGVAVISRDRGGAYAEGGRQGAPEAIQVADRFHLLKNLLESLDRLLIRHQRLLSQVARDVAVTTAPSATPATPASPLPAARRAPRHERESCLRRDRRVARYDAVLEAYRRGTPLATIAQQVGLSRNTVRRYVRAECFPEHAARRHRWRHLARFEAFLRERWNAGEQNAAALFRAIRAQGYRGSASTLREHLSQWRSEPHRPGRRPYALSGQPAPPPVRIFSARQTRWLLVDGIAEPDVVATAYTTALLEQSPPLRQAQALVTEFLRLVRERDGAALAGWLLHAQNSGIAELVSFADGVQRDKAAVEAALRLEWSQGQTEGQVHRLKLVKRQMYGRAKLDLLRQRLLLSPVS